MTSNWPFIILSIFLMAFMGWKETVRPIGSHLFWRLLASFLAVTSLLCLRIPLKILTGSSQTIFRRAVLLTPGFRDDSLREYRSLPLFTLDSSIKRKYPEAQFLLTLKNVGDLNSLPNRIDVLGYGLSAAELASADSLPLFFHLPQPPKGVVTIHWMARIKSGEPLRIQGKVSPSTPLPCTVWLKGFGSTRDSIQLTAGSNLDLSLQDYPKHIGVARYQVVVTNGKDTLQNEPVPFEVLPAIPLKILVLAGSPSYELRFLKTWLGQRGFSVFIRSEISKNIGHNETVNAAKEAAGTLRAPMLDMLDLVIATPEGLDQLSPSESSLLHRRIQEGGLGLLVLTDTLNPRLRWYLAPFKIDRARVKTLPFSVIIGGQPIRTAPWPSPRWTIRPNGFRRTLVVDGDHRILAATALTGSGKISVSLLNETFTWALKGYNQDYSTVWSLMIAESVRQQLSSKPELFTLKTLRAGEESRVGTYSVKAPLSLNISGLHPVWGQDIGINFLWKGIFWPADAGWKTVGNDQSILRPIYVFHPQDWRSLQDMEKIQSSQRFQVKNSLFSKINVVDYSRAFVPRTLFYLIFICSCGFLWVEGRNYGR